MTTNDQVTVRRFTKKPVTISAAQWLKAGDHPEVRAIAPTDDLYFTGMGGATLTDREKYGVIGTLESPAHLVSPGDWIITGIKGEHYPCKPDIFAMTYEAERAATQPAGERALIEENRQLTAKVNEWRDKHTESEESRMELLRLLNEQTGGSTFMGEPVLPPRANVAEMVNRFLGWPLPTTFAPDCGISFDGRKDDEWNKNKAWPIGTNLFNAVEAKAMFEHCLAAPISEDTDGNCIECKGTGMADSGGTYPWGEPALIPCVCDKNQAARTPASVGSEAKGEAARIEDDGRIYGLLDQYRNAVSFTKQERIDNLLDFINRRMSMAFADGLARGCNQFDSRIAAAPERSGKAADEQFLLSADLCALKRFHECAMDFDSGGHDVPRQAMSRLTEIGVCRHTGFGNHQTTAFGDFVLARSEGESIKLPLKTLQERNAYAAIAAKGK